MRAIALGLGCGRVALRILITAWIASFGYSVETRGHAAVGANEDVYVSVVMVGRHDNLRGDYTGRLQNSLDFFLTQGQEFGVRMEIVIVEWNPIPKAARFADILKTPPGCSIPVRVVTVGADFHSEQAASTGQSFFEFMAKNVGSRRSRGKFVLFTNGDVVLSDSVMRIFAAETLDEGAFYRIERTELPGLLDPLAPLANRREVMDELLSSLVPEVSCKVGEKECAGLYNTGVCEGLSCKECGGYKYGPDHAGLNDEPFLPAAGDFFLMAKSKLHAVGGYHQVPSTTHLDSLFVCKVRGAGLRQVVLMRPCFMVHQRHPAPMQPLRYILPGWELTDLQCRSKALEASQFFQNGAALEHASVTHVGESNTTSSSRSSSMDANWGFPDVSFEEMFLKPADTHVDWQALTFLPITHLEQIHIPSFVFEGPGDEERYLWERRSILWVLASLRFHEWRAVASAWCAFEAFSRWNKERLHLTQAVWSWRLQATTCRNAPNEVLLAPVTRSPIMQEGICGAGDLINAVPSGTETQSNALGDTDVYVSVVVAARADEMRGDSVLRLQNVIDVICHGFQKHRVRGEIVIVEWMPREWFVKSPLSPSATMMSLRLSSLLRVKKSNITVSIVTIAPWQEREEWKGRGLGFWEYEAKNIGARRARGRFVLLSNSDVIPSPSVFQFLAAESLDPKCLYRAKRVELQGIVDVQAPLDQRTRALSLLEFILSQHKNRSRGEVRERQEREYQQATPQCSVQDDLDDYLLHAEGAGDFTLMSQEAFDALGGYSPVATTMHLDKFLLCRARGLGLKLVFLGEPCTVFHQSHPAPVMVMKRVAPGWEWSKEQCEAQRAATAHASRQASGVHRDWGWPQEMYHRSSVQVAGINDWQWHSLQMELDDQIDDRHVDRQIDFSEEYTMSAHDDEGVRLCNEEDQCESDGQGHTTHDRALQQKSRQEQPGTRHGIQHDPRYDDVSQSHLGDGSSDARLKQPHDRVVFCVASTAERVRIMQEALISIQEQAYKPDVLYVSLPDGAARPEFLSEGSGVTVVSHREDLGPVHKLLDCAREEPDPETIIVTFDDDMRVDPGLADRLVHAIKQTPNAAVGFAGWHVRGLLSREPPEFKQEDFAGQHLPHASLPMRVDVLEGYAGVAYRRGFFALEDLESVRDSVPEARYADDVWISGCLARRGIARIVIPLRDMPPGTEGLPLDVMFRDIWAQTTPQEQGNSLKKHPGRGRRNQAVAATFQDVWEQ